MMERVLFICNITYLYSDWISWFNSMLVHDCLAAGWEEGFELWLFQKGWGLEQLVSQRDGIKPELRRPIMAGHGVLLSCATFYWEHFTSNFFLPLTVAVKLHDSCLYSPCSPGSDLFVCQPWAKELCFSGWCDKLSIYTFLRWDNFYSRLSPLFSVDYYCQSMLQSLPLYHNILMTKY